MLGHDEGLSAAARINAGTLVTIAMQSPESTDWRNGQE